MRLGSQKAAPLVVAALLAALFTSCAATVKDVRVQPIVAGQHLKPPSSGQNKVYLEFTDQTGGDFSDRVRTEIEDRVIAKGYDIDVAYDEADYVVYATLRLFDKVGSEAGNKALAGLGAVAGGIAAGVVTAEITESGTAAWIAGLGAGGVTGWAIEKATRSAQWAMAIDVQVGRRLTQEVKSTLTVDDQQHIGNVTAAAANSGIVNSVDAGGSDQKVTKRTEVVETSAFLDLQQRFIAQATSQRASKDQVAEALVGPLSRALSEILPRYRGK